MDVKEAYAYCGKVARETDTNFYLGFMFLPKEKRNAIFASYAFLRYVDDVVEEESGDFEAALGRWQKDLEASYAGQPPENPICIALADAVKRYPIPKESFKGLIEGCKWDLVKNRYATFEELLRYCELVAVTISRICLAVFGYKDAKAVEYGKNLAMAFQLTNVCRDVGEDARKKRIYLPLDELKRFGVTEEQVLKGEMNENFKRLMQFQVERARSYYESAYPIVEAISSDCRMGVLLMGAAYVKVLEQVEKNDYDVFTKKASIPDLKKAMVVMQTLFFPHLFGMK